MYIFSTKFSCKFKSTFPIFTLTDAHTHVLKQNVVNYSHCLYYEYYYHYLYCYHHSVLAAMPSAFYQVHVDASNLQRISN